MGVKRVSHLYYRTIQKQLIPHGLFLLWMYG